MISPTMLKRLHNTPTSRLGDISWRIFLAILIFLSLLVCCLPFANAATYSPVGSNGTPTTTSCGTGNGSVVGTDAAGVITLGTVAVTACTLSFSATLSYTPVCTAVTGSAASVAFITSVSTSALVLGLTVTLPGGTVYYNCTK